ncbi:hypothetical protein [Devosia pacifica]|uniref:hypothetical protein n=1 Tax=Devosia pacifica TaxID=1335967 RepID=UPI001674AE4A|nr:hypothetical protein [Devosia pacifica]
MREPIIAIFAASPALASVLSMVVAGDPKLRVRVFDSAVSLRAYMRIAPISVLVCDCDREDVDMPAFVMSLREDPDAAERRFSSIALSRQVSRSFKRQIDASGIDEVLVKPMSPRHLLERVHARLARRSRSPSSPRPRHRPLEWGPNVVELFPGGQPAL